MMRTAPFSGIILKKDDVVRKIPVRVIAAAEPQELLNGLGLESIFRFPPVDIGVSRKASNQSSDLHRMASDKAPGFDAVLHREMNGISTFSAGKYSGRLLKNRRVSVAAQFP